MSGARRPAVLLLGDTLDRGGTEGQFVEVACRLDRSRWDVRVACLRAEGPLRARLEAAGFTPWSCGRGGFRSPRLALAVAGLARDLHRHGIALVHSFDFYSNVLGVLAARLAGRRVVASQRDLGDLKPRLPQAAHRLGLRLAHGVVVNSEAVAARVRGGLPPGRVEMITNGVDLDRFAPAPGPRGGPSVVGTLGNLRGEKGHADFVRAAALVRARCPGTRFVLWGDGPHRRPLETLVTRLGLAGVVRMPGATPSPEAALREMDVFVLPSLSEACSNALLEAMATGLAVIATRVGGNAGLVDDGEDGLLVPPGEPAALAKAIIAAVEDRALAARLGARALRTARARHGFDTMLGRLDALYRRVLGQAP